MNEMNTSEQMIAVSTSSSPILRAFKDFTAGTIGGVAQVLVGHPFNTVKARLQMQPTPPIYKNALDCIKITIQNEGWRGLYKGMGSPLVGIGFVNAVGFYGNEESKRILCKLQNLSSSTELNNASLTLAGSIAGGLCALVSSPVELLMVRLQTQHIISPDRLLYNGPIHCLRQIIRQEGVQSIYKGFAPTFQREFWSYGAYFGTYAILKNAMLGKDEILISQMNESTRVGYSFIAGGIAGLIAQLISLPFDAIKVRIQTNHSNEILSSRTCFQNLLKTEGIPGFFRGIGPVAVRAFPANGATFVAFEAALKLLN